MACQREFPQLVGLHNKYAKKGLAVVAVQVDAFPAKQVADWVRGQKARFPVLLDPGGKTVTPLYGMGFPKHVLIDRQGKVLKQGGMGDSLSPADVEKMLPGLLGK